MSDIIDKLETPEECDTVISNNLTRKPELAIRARIKKVELLASKHDAESDVEKEIIKALYAYEEALFAKWKRRQKASYTRRMFDNHGKIEAVERLVNRSQETTGLKTLRELGMLEYAFEAVVLRHPQFFSEQAVERSKERMKE